jgi:hypothetical protein
MTPLSPALFLAAVHALAADTVLRVKRPDHRDAGRVFPDRGVPVRGDEVSDADACAFIDRAGRASHYEDGAGESAWPLPAAHSAAAFRAFAEEGGVLRSIPMAGDVYVCARTHPAIASIGVVLQVLDRSREPQTSLSRCEILYGHADGPATIGVRRVTRWFSWSAGDRFIRWVELDRWRPRLTPDAPERRWRR